MKQIAAYRLLSDVSEQGERWKCLCNKTDRHSKSESNEFKHSACWKELTHWLADIENWKFTKTGRFYTMRTMNGAFLSAGVEEEEEEEGREENLLKCWVAKKTEALCGQLTPCRCRTHTGKRHQSRRRISEKSIAILRKVKRITSVLAQQANSIVCPTAVISNLSSYLF